MPATAPPRTRLFAWLWLGAIAAYLLLLVGSRFDLVERARIVASLPLGAWSGAALRAGHGHCLAWSARIFGWTAPAWLLLLGASLLPFHRLGDAWAPRLRGALWVLAWVVWILGALASHAVALE